MRMISNSGHLYIKPFNNKKLADVGHEVSKSFSRETRADIFHYCRALAMEAEVESNNLQYEQAIAVVQKMKLLYDPALHSASIQKVSWIHIMFSWL